MPAARDCASDLATPSHPQAVAWPDILRKEPFGALLYRRRDCSVTAVPPEHARLLVAALYRSILEVYAARGGLAGLDDQGFAELVAGWRAEGLLDADYRCTAELVEAPRRPGQLTAPLVTHIELTERCNLRCQHCYMAVRGVADDDGLSTARLDALFAELAELGAPLVVLAGGEPLLRDDLDALLDSLARHHLDAWLCSNATLIDRPLADRLVRSALRGYSISLDGPDAGSHDRLRGRGQFARACAGVAALIEAGAADVKLRVTVTPEIVARLGAFAPLAQQLGVHKVVFKPFARLGEAGDATDLELDRARYLDAAARALEAWPAEACPAEFSDGIPTRAPDWLGVSPRFGCIAGTTAVTVAADGRVLACGSDRPAEAWRLADHSLAECWRDSPTLKRWRNLQPGVHCTGCDQLARCAGACRARALATGQMGDPDPWLGC